MSIEAMQVLGVTILFTAVGFLIGLASIDAPISGSAKQQKETPVHGYTMNVTFQINGGNKYEGDISQAQGTPQESTFLLHTKWKMVNE